MPARPGLRHPCPRCHLRHDRQQHLQSAYRNRRKRWAVGELFD